MMAGGVKKARGISSKALLGLAAALVFVAQVAAMVLVVQGQVAKAERRDRWGESAQAALVDCSPRTVQGGPCPEQVQASAYPVATLQPLPQSHTLSAHASTPGALAPVGRGVVQATFSP